MNRNDIQVWVRFYLYDGKSVDVDFEPLSYRSHSEYVDAFDEHWTEYSNQDQDYDIVDWDYLDQQAAFGMYDDKDVWDAYNNLFDLAKEYGLKPETMFELVNHGWGIDQLEDVMENAYEGEHDYPSLRNFAYYLVDEELLNENYYANLFDYGSFGRDLKYDFDMEMLVEDWGLDISEAEDLLDGSDEDFAEWYIDGIGDVADLGKETLVNYVDFQKLERELEYEGYYVIDGHVFRPY
tara:strand:+ start:9791 stop:10501 length:711 start_codon:yes stop_codon:yes gene_type:complete